MKRLLVLAILPMLLFGLETVNLIKDAGFEKESEVWLMRSEADGEYDSTEVSRHDSDSAYIGNYCGSIDTRKQPMTAPPHLYMTEGYLYQDCSNEKTLEDLDSLIYTHMTVFEEPGGKSWSWGYGLILSFHNPLDESQITVAYYDISPDREPPSETPTIKIFSDTIWDEGSWRTTTRNLSIDLIDGKGLSDELELDSVELFGYGIFSGSWRGQKAFFDGIRLMGYADYDVGVKEILSGDSLEVGTPYASIARIKNFGRENADSFLVIAEIADGASIIYSDTLPWTLPGDTEDTVTFADFNPPGNGPYTLTIRTFMTPDESDEDDGMSKILSGSAVAEDAVVNSIDLDVLGFLSEGVLRVSYSLPYGKRGTLTLYDASGRRLERITVTHPGSVELDSALASGVYLIRLEVGDYSISRKAVLLK